MPEHSAALTRQRSSTTARQQMSDGGEAMKTVAASPNARR
jgi:hypothetical protein